MKNLFVLPIFTVIFLSSCGTYAGSGAMTGGSLGSVLGSAIGGIAGGGRGSNIGTIVGMAGGAMVGATIGAKADKHNKSFMILRIIVTLILVFLFRIGVLPHQIQ